uniref:Kazal-like domain-containing protein n=1 Tax=Gopherus agassizii TaxID=38772 RepID=A0A452GVN5_9SAUR
MLLNFHSNNNFFVWQIDCSRYPRTKDPRKIACPRNFEPVCGTDACPRIYAPVCGTNGVTYDNECLLCAEILKGATIRLAHKGQCMVKVMAHFY